jgi:hypothetical protein
MSRSGSPPGENPTRRADGENRSFDLSRPGPLEPSDLTQFFLPIPEHDAKSSQGRQDTQKCRKKQEAQQKEIDDGSGHRNPVVKLLWRGNILTNRGTFRQEMNETGIRL